MVNAAKLFAENLKRFREESHMTQETLSERLGVSVVTISNYENARRWPKPRALDEICKILNVSPADLFIPVGMRPLPTPQEALEVIARALKTHPGNKGKA